MCTCANENTTNPPVAEDPELRDPPPSPAPHEIEDLRSGCDHLIQQRPDLVRPLADLVYTLAGAAACEGQIAVAAATQLADARLRVSVQGLAVELR
jgi:hypothetical protein